MFQRIFHPCDINKPQVVESVVFIAHRSPLDQSNRGHETFGRSRRVLSDGQYSTADTRHRFETFLLNDAKQQVRPLYLTWRDTANEVQNKRDILWNFTSHVLKY